MRARGTIVRSVFVVVSLGISSALTPPTLGAQPTLERLPAQPAGLPDWLAPHLEAEGLRVLSSEGGTLAEFWFRRELPGRPATAAELGVEYGSLPPGALLAVVQLGAEWSDYRKQRIVAGRYTLRYAIQPADGDHTGETYYRDFLLLIPVDQDVFQLDAAEIEPLVEAGKEAAQSNHPAVMALYPVYDEVAEDAIVPNEVDEPTLVVHLGPLVLGIVLEGYGGQDAAASLNPGGLKGPATLRPGL